MKQYDYTKRIEKILERVEKSIERDKNTIYSVLFSSCLNRFYPSLPITKHGDFAKKVLINQALAWEEQGDIALLSNCKVVNSEELSATPKIYCSFHLSSYRLCLLYLLTNNIPITLIASQNVIKEQGSLIMQLHGIFSKTPPDRIIDANKPSSIFSMIGELRKGRSLFVYVDGNTGALDDRHANETLLKVDILNSHIKVRTGIAYLSQITGVPIVPIISTRDTDYFPKIELLSPIYPESNESERRYIERSVNELYLVLNKRLVKYAEQWEAWMYLYKFAEKKVSIEKELRKMAEQESFSFNRKRYLVWNNNNQCYLMDNCDFSLITIDQEIRTILEKNKIYSSEIPRDLLQKLVKKEILI